MFAPTPPPAYRSNLPTPAATPRPSCSTTESSSRYSGLSFAQSISSSFGTSPPVSIRERPFSHQGVPPETIYEPKNEEQEDDSPVDPRQMHDQPSSSSSSPPKSYLYFSPFTPSTPPRPRPAQPRSYSTSSFYAYPIDYGESASWDYRNQVRNGGGTDTPRSARSFKTMATDGSGVDMEEISSEEVGEGVQGNGEEATNLAVENLSNSNRPQPTPLVIDYLDLPSPEPFHPTTPLNASLFSSANLSPLTNSPEPFAPTSPLTSYSSSSSSLGFSSSVSSPLSRNPPSPSSTLSLSATSTSSLTVTPSSLTPTPTRYSLSRSPPQRIWSARTNRYIYIHDNSTSSLPRSNSTLSPGPAKTPSVRSTEMMVQIPDLPYVTRSPETRGTVEEELEMRGRSRERGERDGGRSRSRRR
ncbi:hypothetical protein JCM5353_003972 [Sporobolomyces roseus]